MAAPLYWIGCKDDGQLRDQWKQCRPCVCSSFKTVLSPPTVQCKRYRTCCKCLQGAGLEAFGEVHKQAGEQHNGIDGRARGGVAQQGGCLFQQALVVARGGCVHGCGWWCEAR